MLVRLSSVFLDNHLGNTVTAEGLAADEGLATDTGEGVADRSEEEEDGSRDQARGDNQVAQELDNRHDKVGGGAEIVGRDLADKLVELAGRGADAQQQGNLNKEDEEGGHKGESAEDDEKGVDGEDVGDAQGKAQNHGQDTQPLSVDAEVAGSELVGDRHVEELLFSRDSSLIWRSVRDMANVNTRWIVRKVRKLRDAGGTSTLIAMRCE